MTSGAGTHCAISPPIKGPMPNPRVIATVVRAAMRLGSRPGLACTMPTEAEVVIIPDARPISRRATMKDGTFQAAADSTTPEVITIRPARRIGRKPKRCVRRPRNSRLANTPNM